MGKRQEAALETKRKLLLAAEKLISEKGFDNISVEDITHEAGVAKGTFYTYFKRKEDVSGEIALAMFKQIEAKSKTQESIYLRIDEFLTESMKYIVETGINIARQWLKTISDEGETGGDAKLEYDIMTVKKMLDEAVSVGEIDSRMDTLKTSQAICSTYYGAVLLWCMTDAGIEPISFIHNFCESNLKKMLGE